MRGFIKMLNSILVEDMSKANLSQVLICIASALIIGLIISLVHMYKNVYTKNFIVTLFILPVMIESIIFLVNGNLGTGVAILGAFSLVRFRSQQGTARDIASIFWSMTSGLAIGTGYIGFAFLISIVLVVTQLLLFRLTFGEMSQKSELERKLVLSSQDFLMSKFERTLSVYCLAYDCVEVKLDKEGKVDAVYNIVLKNRNSEYKLLEVLRKKNHVDSVKSTNLYKSKKNKTL